MSRRNTSEETALSNTLQLLGTRATKNVELARRSALCTVRLPVRHPSIKPLTMIIAKTLKNYLAFNTATLSPAMSNVVPRLGVVSVLGSNSIRGENHTP
tara:strand:- start:212 stop:508 length:297 start_codon:yes stop_codon:yes gene_type:complete